MRIVVRTALWSGALFAALVGTVLASTMVGSVNLDPWTVTRAVLNTLAYPSGVGVESGQVGVEGRAIQVPVPDVSYTRPFALDVGQTEQTIVQKIRLPRIVLGAVVGFAIALSAPTTAGSAIIWTRFARGDVQLATTASIVSLLVAPVVTPIVLTRLVGTQAAVPVGSILTDLAIIVGGGALIAAIVPSDALSPRTIDRGATLAILLLIYTSVAGVEVTEVTGWHVLTVVGLSVLLVAFGLVISALCERGLGLSRSRTIPLFLTSTLKNLGIALLIALAYTDPLVVFSIITYYIVQQLSGAVLADTIA